MKAIEKQVRPLTNLKPEQQREVWQASVETAPLFRNLAFPSFVCVLF